MTTNRPDVAEALLAAGWTHNGNELRNGDLFWRATTQPGDSALRRGVDWIAEFTPHCPAIAVVAACLAAAGQPVDQLADVIPLRPHATPTV
ncbi:hypothetical protein [Streptomyces sp. NPDC001422]|uniref:hypothetical protein n=1 Tax=Streptomyces sp. NPDC001422 TaxID=3364575 RepID=UPI003676A7BF